MAVERAPLPFRAVIAAALVVAACGCVALGWQFGPGVSSSNRGAFAAPPVIVHGGSGYSLVWIYGDAGFYFRPRYQVVDDRLVFALQGTSSSGALRGERGSLPIEGADAIRALQTGGAWWWEPDGRYVRLDVIEYESPYRE